MLSRKKRVFLFSILLILLLIVLSFSIIVHILYNKGLKSLPDKIESIDFSNTSDSFNKSVWIYFVGDKPIRIKPINHISYFYNLIFNKNNHMNTKNGSWIISSMTASLLLNNSNENLDKKNELYYNLSSYSISVWISKNWTAEKCLNVISNYSYFGNNYYGLEKVSEGYYSKRPAELSIDEISFLISMLLSPAYYDPVKYPENSKKIVRLIKSKIESSKNIEL